MRTTATSPAILNGQATSLPAWFVDMLVEFETGHVPGLDFVVIERELSRLLQGRRVDLVTPKFLNSRIRQQVLNGAGPIYVAA